MFDVQTQGYDLDELIEWPDAVADEPRPIVQPGYQLPAWIWKAMFASYAIFFTAMFLMSRGSTYAVMMVVISALYTIVYFGVAGALARQSEPDELSPLEQGRPLPTWCGPMSLKAVASQILIVPFAIAFFGTAVLIIRAVVGA